MHAGCACMQHPGSGQCPDAASHCCAAPNDASAPVAFSGSSTNACTMLTAHALRVNGALRQALVQLLDALLLRLRHEAAAGGISGMRATDSARVIAGEPIWPLGPPLALPLVAAAASSPSCRQGVRRRSGPLPHASPPLAQRAPGTRS